MTPLTRQVMTKSIHRAIKEYQHANNGSMMSPRSPLDLRTSFVIRREIGSPNKSPKLSKSPKSPKTIENGNNGTKLKIIMEQIKDSNDNENKENNDGAVSSVNIAKHNDSIDIGACKTMPIEETPIAISRKLSNEKLVSSSDGEIWHTPKEIAPPMVKDEVCVIWPLMPLKVDSELDNNNLATNFLDLYTKIDKKTSSAIER